MPVLLAFKFLTVLPVPVPDDVSPKTMGRAVAFYPLVGLVIGLLLAGADLLMGLVLPGSLRSALILVLWVGLTGGLHLDGFIDCCDGLLATQPPEKRLEILRDVHAGSFAVVGAVLLLLSKYAALASLQGPLRLGALIVVPALARWAMVYAVIGYPYARPGPGLGRLVKECAGPQELVIASVLATVPAVLAWNWPGLAALPLTFAFTWLLARWIMTRIPGLTGDTYGAIAELVEAAWLVGLVALLTVRL